MVLCSLIDNREFIRVDSARTLIVEGEHFSRGGQAMGRKISVKLRQRLKRKVGTRNERVHLLGRNHLQHGDAVADIFAYGREAKADHGVLTLAVLAIRAECLDDSFAGKARSIIGLSFGAAGRAFLLSVAPLISQLFGAYGGNPRHSRFLLLTLLPYRTH